MFFSENYSLLKHNTFGIPAFARYFAEYKSVGELKEAIKKVPVNTPILHIGGGSNLLFLKDYDGLVLHSKIDDTEVIEEGPDDVVVRVGASIVWDDFVEMSIRKGWYGLENLSLIPGEVGASAVQNIGAYGAEAADHIIKVECVNLNTCEFRTFQNSECHYAYRQSIFKTPEERGKWAVLHVVYQLSKHFNPRLDYGGIRSVLEKMNISTEHLTAIQLREVIIEIRRGKLPDPKIQGNAGSFFMNPIVFRSVYEKLIVKYPNMPHYDVDADMVKIPAGWMIDQCGWKGRALGPAAVHDRQALVLVNLGGAKGQDIVNLCEAVRKDVYKKFGIEIHPEVNFIG